MRHKFYFIVVLFLLSISSLSAQDIEAIKHNPSYIWGQGTGSTLQAADEQAVRDLVSQISVNIESSTQTTISNVQQLGSATTSVSTTGDTRVSSSAALSNCKRAVVQQKNGFIVVRYIEVEEVERMFAVRIDKIWDLVHAGERADELNKVSDVLRNYYWALKMLSTMPEERRAQVQDENGVMLTTWLREQIVQTMERITLKVMNASEEDDVMRVELEVLYKGERATSCDYSYFDGYDWLQASVKDGYAVVETSVDARRVRIRVEYVFAPLWKSDPVVYELLSQMPTPFPFPENEKSVAIAAQPQLQPQQPQPQQVATNMMLVDTIATCAMSEVEKVSAVIEPVLKAIETKSYNEVRSNFTENGWRWFDKLIRYGQAKILSQTELQVSAFSNGYLVRGVKANFRFKKNNRSFVEDIVFYVKDGRIDGINFGLEEGALHDICRHSMWDAQSRLVLVNFLENYKTAYALERLDYLNAIFSDDALIIVGMKLPETRVSEITAMDMESYQHNRLTKNQYMEHLSKVFAKQEYVNIQFEDASVKKTSRNNERYEIIIKQNYYSTTYADKGYLFLLADISDPERPIIHVRVWDENKNNLMDYGEWIY